MHVKQEGTPDSPGLGTRSGASLSDRGVMTSGYRIAFYAAIPVAVLVLLFLDRHQWFFYDEWEFFARGLGGQPLDLFRPHTEHWSTIPILIFHGLYSVVGLRSYIPYLVVLFALHVAVSVLLWLTMLRVGADGWVATAFAVIFLLLGAGAQDLTWAFQIGFIASVLCGLVAVLLADHHGTRFGARDGFVWLALVVGIMSSGVGLSMVALAALVALLRRGWRAALVVVSVPVAVYVVWWLAIGRHYLFLDSTVNAVTLLLIPDYVWAGLTATVDQASGLVGFGAVAVIGILVWAVVNHRMALVLPVAFSAAATAVIFFALTGIDRTAGGVAEAGRSRYVYVATALLLPVAAVIVSSLARRGLIAQVAVLLVAAFAAVHGTSALGSYARFESNIKRASELQILAAAQLIKEGATLIGNHPDDQWAPDLTLRDLSIMLHDGRLPPLTGISTSALLNAKLALQVEIAALPLVTQTNSVVVEAGVGSFLTAPSDGCFDAATYGSANQVILDVTGPASLSLMLPAGGVVSATLAIPMVIGTSGPRTLADLSANELALLSISQPSAVVTLVLPPGTARLCGDLIAAGPTTQAPSP